MGDIAPYILIAIAVFTLLVSFLALFFGLWAWIEIRVWQKSTHTIEMANNDFQPMGVDEMMKELTGEDNRVRETRRPVTVKPDLTEAFDPDLDLDS